MNSRTMALAAVALVMVAAAGIAVYITTDDEYSISYELNGGTQNQLNPTTYTEGKQVTLYDPYDDDLVFVSWYLDKELTRPVDSLAPGTSGDITLYAGWTDTVVGKALEFKVSGSYDSGILNSYLLDGTVTYSYLYQNDEGRYLISTQTEMEYRFFDTTQHTSSEDSYWSGDSDYTEVYIGKDTIGTVNGEKVCDVVRLVHSDGSSETQWIGDGWITYRIEYRSQQMFTLVQIVYELSDVYSFQTDSEVGVTAFADLGINVTGDGTYSPGDSVTLVAEPEPGTEFSGWYDSDGDLVSASSTYTFTAQYGDISLYAMNSQDPDIVTSTGTPLTSDGSDGTTWSIYDSDGVLYSSFTGNPEQFSFDDPGSYTIVTYDPETGVHRQFTAMVDGYTTVGYEWTVDGTTYTYSLSILYSDVEYYRDYYDVSQRQQDIVHNHQRDVTFVTYGDEYIQRMAADFAAMTSGMTDLERVGFLLAFVQAIGYEDDEVYMGYEEYWKFPLETLYDHGGDCEDTSILLAALSEAMGYDAALILMPGHMATGVHIDGTHQGLQGFYYTSDPNKVYYYCETTSTGYDIGRIPSGVDTSDVTLVTIP